MNTAKTVIIGVIAVLVVIGIAYLVRPSHAPMPSPTPSLSVSPTVSSTPTKTVSPSSSPRKSPGASPTASPVTTTVSPTVSPTTIPSVTPSAQPSPTSSPSPTPSTSGAVTHQVSIGGSGYSPSPLTIARGDSVVFTNQSPFSQTVTAFGGGFSSGTIAVGAQWTLFSSALLPGSYDYRSTLHPTLRGTIIVQ